jgi:urease accessory protein
MPGKMTKSILRPPFRPPQVPAAVRSSRLCCGKVAKAQIFTSARESSGESRLRSIALLRIEQVLGSRLDPAFAERIHELEHQGAVDLLTVPATDVARHRLRATTQGGTGVAIALPRDQHLFDGAVLVLEPNRAVVVRVAQERWLRLQPRSIADAIELGHHAGNLHWRVRFAGEALLVAMEAPMDDYLARIDALIRDRRVISSLAEADEILL